MPVMRQVLRAVRNAFLSKGFVLFGPRFSRDYLRFARMAARQWGHAGAGEVELVGFRVPYPNQTYALFLVHEIFVNATYAFRARRGRPHIVDCGANIGMSVVFFKAYAPNATIVAIEPEPATFSHLQRTVEINGLKDVELRNVAVARAAGTARLYGDASDAGSMTASLDPTWGGTSVREVPAVRLSSLIDRPVDFLKLDVEGAEYDVVEDLAETGALQQVSETVIECHELDGRPDARDQMVARLRESGMDVRFVPQDAAAARISMVHGVARRSGVQSGPKRVPAISRTTSA